MTRLMYGLLFALPLGLVSAAWVQASPPGPTTNPDRQCETCHLAVHQAWEESKHGQAVTDPVFVESWESQGEPKECLQCHTTGYDPATGTWEADGITCAACHSPIAEGHPLKTMPTDRSAEMCAICHVETAFAWQVSTHAVNDLTCVTCHGQHSTNIKAGDPSALCVSCHLDVSENFVHKQHSAEGMSCASCHLGSTGDTLGGGAASRDHSFAVVLTTCETCHASEAHPGEVLAQRPSPDSNPEVTPLEFETAGLNPESGEVNPLTFALLAALVGMAAGMILAPWIERWYHRLGK
ncbi:MAG TPA: multiheme c-type cytochrome [Anaerolineales bacterium]|nr:multiheme c-type cytochrome [Anaerolineales bacterium]